MSKTSFGFGSIQNQIVFIESIALCNTATCCTTQRFHLFICPDQRCFSRTNFYHNPQPMNQPVFARGVIANQGMQRCEACWAQRIQNTAGASGTKGRTRKVAMLCRSAGRMNPHAQSWRTMLPLPPGDDMHDG